MRYLYLLILLITGSDILFAQIPPGYYNGTAGLSGSPLKAALHNIIKGHTELSYTAVKEALKVTDEDPQNPNNVICLYTGWSYPKTEFGNGSEQWNREHTWSKSHGDFGNLPPCGTDLHHLRPADASVNSAKNNRDFSNGITQYIDGSGSTDCYYKTDIWEPPDTLKGDVARMIFYMAVRYEGENGEPDLEIVDSVNTAPANEPNYGKLSDLLAWHSSDPVDGWEQNRNDVIYYSYQGNRNPFIDHPEFADSIWSSSGGGGGPQNMNLLISEVADPGNAASAKFVELYNAGTDTIFFNTATWYLSRQANGSSWADVQLAGYVAPNETFVLSYDTIAFQSSYGFKADMNSGVVSGNGNDSYFLYSNGPHSSGTLVDAYGVPDVDGTGQNWEYTNSKAVRIYNDTLPDTTWNTTEWYISSSGDDTDMTPGWHRRTIDWTGTVSTTWSTTANWNDKSVTSPFLPDAGSYVIINTVSNNPTIAVEAVCGKMLIKASAQLTLSPGGTLIVADK